MSETKKGTPKKTSTKSTKTSTKKKQTKKEKDMAGKIDAVIQIIGVAGTAATELLNEKSIRRGLFGTYSDGSIRNLPDAWNGEILSPKTKEKYLYKNKKKKGKKKAKKKNKDSINSSLW